MLMVSLISGLFENSQTNTRHYQRLGTIFRRDILGKQSKSTNKNILIALEFIIYHRKIIRLTIRGLI